MLGEPEFLEGLREPETGGRVDAPLFVRGEHHQWRGAEAVAVDAVVPVGVQRRHEKRLNCTAPAKLVRPAGSSNKFNCSRGMAIQC